MPRYKRYGELDDPPVGGMDMGFTGYSNRLRPDQLQPGILAESLNGRIDINGEWQVRKGVDLILAPFTAVDFTLDFFLYESLPAIDSYSDSGTTLTINFVSAHNITDQTVVNLNGLTGAGADPDPNDNYVATVPPADVDTITVVIPTMTGTPTGTLTVTGPDLEDDNANQIYGTVAYYDPSNSNTSYVILAGSGSAYAVNVQTGASTQITYPDPDKVTSECHMIQYYNSVYIFRVGDTAMVWDGDLSGSPAFALVANGAFTQYARMAATGFTITNEIATVVVTHALAVGDEVTLIAAGSSTLDEGTHFTVAKVTGTSSFTFHVYAENVLDQTDVVFIKKGSTGIGFIHMPCPRYAISHQKRLVMPFDYTQTGSSGSPTITDRGVRDEIIMSNIGDADTYDWVYGQFKFSPNKSDYTVALHSFNDDKLVILNRESIYVIEDSLVLTEAHTTMLTEEIGCVARDTVVQVGNNMIFLSDNGLYALDFQDLYNLRGRDLPLSESVNETFKRINKAYVHNARGVYFDNRYYLAVPLDDAMTNNALIVYNFLNKEWESVDTVDDIKWDYRWLIVAGNERDRGLYTVNRYGGVHQVDVKVDASDAIISQVGGSQSSLQILGTATTRMYTSGTMERKKWNNWDMHIQSSGTNTSNANLSVITENIDDDINLGTIESVSGTVLAAGEDLALRGRVGNRRAYGIQFKMETTEGRPKLRRIEMGGYESMRNLNKAE